MYSYTSFAYKAAIYLYIYTQWQEMEKSADLMQMARMTANIRASIS